MTNNERFEQIANRFLDTELTLEAVGQEYGLTRERVRQIAAMFDPDGSRRAAHKSRVKRSQELRRDEEQWQELKNRAKAAQPCVVCGSWVLRSRQEGTRRTCSHECGEAWPNLRFHFDPVIREKHRGTIARWCVANPDKVSSSQLNWSKKVLAGKPIQSNGRWTLPGSKTSQLIEQFGLSLDEVVG